MSVRFQADNDLKSAIIRAARRREPGIDFLSAQEAGLDGVSDPELLDRAAGNGRVVVSHDHRTMLSHFRNHLAAGKFSPGLRVVSQRAPIRDVIESLLLVWVFSDPEELRDQAYYLPSLSQHFFSR